MKYFLVAVAWMIALVPAALPAMADTAPVEITADNSLEWNRKAKTYTARGRAVAAQGALKVTGDTLTARYNDQNGGTDITEMTAAGGVTISSAPYTAFGDKAVYDLGTGRAVLTGSDLKITTPTETLVARDNISFDTNANRLSANGNAVATRGTDTLKADTMNAFFAKDANGKLAMQKITADGNVSIKTARETVTGAAGTYDIVAGKATLTGQVVIVQGNSRIEGTRAEVDLATGISRLFADGNAVTQGRVKGVFYPKGKAPAP